jgi:hypothetical protein
MLHRPPVVAAPFFPTEPPTRATRSDAELAQAALAAACIPSFVEADDVRGAYPFDLTAARVCSSTSPTPLLRVLPAETACLKAVPPTRIELVHTV